MPDIAVVSEPAAHAGDFRSYAVERYFAAIESGEYGALEALLSPDSVTSWPQSGETITGALACIRVYQNYPGGPPTPRLARISGKGDVRIAELIVEYGADRWYVTSIFEFSGHRIARVTDYFGPILPAPDWRHEYVDAVGPAAPLASR